jgi:3'(2'), 5'-bisphosphate nucleotidase
VRYALPATEPLIRELLRIAARAAEAVGEVYAQPFDVDYKGPNDPVTQADRRSNEIICEELGRLTPGVPCVAEESDAASYAGWRERDAVWFVDPLDGTRDFVAKNGEFVVMIGLAREGQARLGVIHAPASGRRFFGGEDVGAFEVLPDGTRRPLGVTRVARLDEAHLVVSRSHASPALEAAFAARAVRRTTRVGSAGLKALRVACGKAEIYAHLGYAGWRWDVCAPEAIARAAGGRVTDARGRPIDYQSASLRNEDGVLLTNGLVHDQALGVMIDAARSSGPTDA